MSTKQSIIYFDRIHMYFDIHDDKIYWDNDENEDDPIEVPINVLRDMCEELNKVLPRAKNV